MRILGLVMTAVLAVAGAAAPAQAATPAWTHAGYGPGNTGYNPAESVVNATTIKKLKLKWRAVARPGTEGCSNDQTTPVVAGNRMFVLDGDGVAAYHLATGKRLWSDLTVMDSDVHRTMTVAGGLVITTGYSCYGNSDPSGHIVALNAATGKVKWTRTEGSATELVVADAGMLVSYSMCGVCSSYLVSGYRATDGAPKWSTDGRLGSPVSAAGRLLLTSAENEGSFAVDATDGDQLWSSAVRWSVLAANPAGNQFYVRGPNERLAALNASTGKALWTVPGGAGQVAADGTRVYVSAAGGVTAYNAATGKKLWKRAGVPESRPVRAGGLLYVDGNVLSPVNGSLVLKATYSTSAAHAVVVGGRVLRTKGREIQAYAP